MECKQRIDVDCRYNQDIKKYECIIGTKKYNVDKVSIRHISTDEAYYEDSPIVIVYGALYAIITKDGYEVEIEIGLP